MTTKTILCLSAAASVAAFTPAASADDYTGMTEWMRIGNGVLTAGETLEADFTVSDVDGGIVGFEIKFDYSEPVSDASWASDVQLIVAGPSGDDFTVGGFTNIGDADDVWSFDGPGSDADGHYGDSGDDIFLPWKAAPLEGGEFSVVFRNDWFGDENANRYDNVDIRFYTLIPAPGALVMFGVAGIWTRRRRRR